MATPTDRPDHSIPSSKDPRIGKNPGYAEDAPRDRQDARQPETGKLPNPEAGGLRREPGDDPNLASRP